MSRLTKKVKDLTVEEIRKICSSNACNSCPLDSSGVCRRPIATMYEEILEKEIEVSEDDRKRK